jgi:hypothetical protein
MLDAIVGKLKPAGMAQHGGFPNPESHAPDPENQWLHAIRLKSLGKAHQDVTFN